ncbi:MAG: asparagine synthase C-terminal domain-containing protein [Anaeroplasmataceae bacterium]|nr:asparagine synthase C-terminal domain-containing protein [Anaeroplasmataceae bacterium]
MRESLFVKLNRKQLSTGVSVYILGDVRDKNLKKLDELNIISLYSEYGKKLCEYLDGIYTIVIIDANINRLFVFQDFLGFSNSIYFYIDKNKLLLSNSLKRIIKELNKELSFDVKGVKIFIKKGFLPSKKTLIKNIFKVPSNRYLELYLSSFKVKLKYNKVSTYPQKGNVSIKHYNNVFVQSCKSCLNDDLACTISSGYDSNYILYILNKQNEKRLKTFCIGGVVGRNEISTAQEICAVYDGINFYNAYVNGNTFDCYPEIVWALEGAIYESGIFLQFELANLIKKEGVNDILLGECADQVFDYELYHPIYAKIKKILYNFKKGFKKILYNIQYKPYKDVYEMASYKVLKKNGIMLNYYGINGRYPYLTRTFMTLAKQVSKRGDKTKKYHKKVVNSILPKEVTAKLKKIGGATELKALFVGDVSFDMVKTFCKKSRFYKGIKFDDEYYGIDYFMKILYLELFEWMFVQNACKDDTLKDRKLREFMFEREKRCTK